ncbi:jg15937, partial [Pararge aegeria aegeria]
MGEDGRWEGICGLDQKGRSKTLHTAEMGGCEDRNDIVQVPNERTERAHSLQHGREATKGRLH